MIQNFLLDLDQYRLFLVYKKKIIITNCGNVYNFKIDEKYIYLNTNIPLLLLWLWKFEALANISRNGLNKFGFGDA